MTELKNKISFLKRRAKIEISKRFEKQLYALENRKIKRRLKQSNRLVLIYTIGKVGSSSVYDSLKKHKQLNSVPIYHLHALNPKRIEAQKNYYKSSERASLPFHLIQSSVIAKLLDSYKGQVYVFTLIREPIKREVSSIFQDSFNFVSSDKLMEKGIKDIVYEKLNALSKNLPENEWFTNELKEVFGFDIFSENFKWEKEGFKVLENKKARLAFIRLEDLNAKFDAVCKKLFQTEEKYKLIRANVGSDKFYEKDYKRVANEAKLPKEQIDQIVNAPFIQKFYADFIPSIRQLWQKEDFPKKS